MDQYAVGRYVARFLHLHEGALHLGLIAIEVERELEPSFPSHIFDIITFSHDEGETNITDITTGVRVSGGQYEVTHEGLLSLGTYRNGEPAAWPDFTGMDALVQEIHEGYNLPLIPSIASAHAALDIIDRYLRGAGWLLKTATVDPGEAVRDNVGDADDAADTAFAPPDDDTLPITPPINVICENRHVILVYGSPSVALAEYEYLRTELDKSEATAAAEPDAGPRE